MLESISEEEWDLFVKKANVSIFQTSRWIKSFGDRVEFLAIKEQGGLILGGIAISKKSFMGKDIIIPPKMCPYGGIVFGEEIFESFSKVKRYSKVKEFTRTMLDFLKKKYSVIILELSPEHYDFHPFIWEGFDIKVHHTYIITKDDEETILKNMDSKRRNDIKRALRDNIKVSFGKDEKYKNILKRLVAKTFKRQNMEYDVSVVDKVFQASENVMVFVSLKEDNPIAANCIVWDEKSSYYILGGYDHENSHSGAQALAMWEAIKYTFKVLNLEKFDFEGSMVPQIEKFFRGFGGDLVTTYRAEYFNNSLLRFLFDLSKNNSLFKKIRKAVFSR